MITVYHNEQFIESNLRQILGTESAAHIDAQQLVPVAIVDTDDLETAFELVQHGRQGWHKNPQIQALEHSRSTAVGDILRKTDGSCWLIKSAGFEQIEDLQLPELNLKFY